MPKYIYIVIYVIFALFTSQIYSDYRQNLYNTWKNICNLREKLSVKICEKVGMIFFTAKCKSSKKRRDVLYLPLSLSHPKIQFILDTARSLSCLSSFLGDLHWGYIDNLSHSNKPFQQFAIQQPYLTVMLYYIYTEGRGT